MGLFVVDDCKKNNVNYIQFITLIFCFLTILIEIKIRFFSLEK